MNKADTIYKKFDKSDKSDSAKKKKKRKGKLKEKLQPHWDPWNYQSGGNHRGGTGFPHERRTNGNK